MKVKYVLIFCAKEVSDLISTFTNKKKITIPDIAHNAFAATPKNKYMTFRRGDIGRVRLFCGAIPATNSLLRCHAANMKGKARINAPPQMNLSFPSFSTKVR